MHINQIHLKRIKGRGKERKGNKQQLQCEPTKANLHIHHQDEETLKSQKKIVLFTRKIDKFFNAM
jgi:hypothetical protein